MFSGSSRSHRQQTELELLSDRANFSRVRELSTRLVAVEGKEKEIEVILKIHHQTIAGENNSRFENFECTRDHFYSRQSVICSQIS